MLDADGRTVAISEPVTGDEPRVVLRWKSGNLDGVVGKPASLRFALRKAQLYSFWCE